MSLDAWLAVHPGPSHLPDERTALRDMAWNYGQVRGLAAVCLGSGGVTLGGAVLAVATGAGTASLWLLLAAALQAVAGVAAWRSRSVRGIPRTDPSRARGPETVRSGVAHALALGVLFSLPFVALTATMVDDGPAGIATAVALHVLLLGEMFCVFALPAVFVQHARRDFRASILSDPQRHAAFAQMAHEWVDPRGFREFGPL